MSLAVEMAGKAKQTGEKSEDLPYQLIVYSEQSIVGFANYYDWEL